MANAMVWENPFYDPDFASKPYSRFDHTAYGAGLPTAQTFAQGAQIFDSTAGQPIHKEALSWFQKKGIDPVTASDRDKFTAIDWAGRERQRQNQIEHEILPSWLDIPLTLASFIPGPIGIGARGLKAVDSFGEGDYLGGALSTLGAVSKAAGNYNFPGSSAINSATGAVGKAVGKAAGGAKNFFTQNFGGGGDYVNAGINAADLYNPASLGGATQAASGLGVSGADFFNPSWAGLGEGINGVVGYGNGYSPGYTSVPGGTVSNVASAEDLYNPASSGFGGPLPTNFLANPKGLAGAALGVVGAPGTPEGAGGGDAYTPAASAGLNALVAAPGGGQSPINYTLADIAAGSGGGGQSPPGSRLQSGAGSGAMPPEPGRVPGYQRRPFGNYLLR